MIVVVEGPARSGRTTWCRRHVGRYVPAPVTAGEPVDAAALARHRVRDGVRRWADAARSAAADGVAWCDTDPLRLCHTWSLAAAGLAPPAVFDRELAVTREAVRTGRLGLADAVLVARPGADEPRRDTAGGPATIAGHLRLREPLIRWYAALDALDPGRVVWDLPAGGPPPLPAPRPDRCSVELVDALVAALPPLRAGVGADPAVRRP